MVTEVVEVEVRRSWGCRAWRTSSARRGRGSPWWPPPPATPHPYTSTWGAASTPPASTPSPSEYRLEDHHILDNRIYFFKKPQVDIFVTKATLKSAPSHLEENEQWTEHLQSWCHLSWSPKSEFQDKSWLVTSLHYLSLAGSPVLQLFGFFLNCFGHAYHIALLCY